MNDAAERAYVELSLGDFLELVAARRPAPGGGSVAAIVAALSAALATMAARFADHHLAGASELAGRSERLRARVTSLAQADAAAYRRVLDASSRRGGESETRAALLDAADVPLGVAEVCVELADIALALVERGNPTVRGDAIAAALFGEAALRATVSLAAINLVAAGVVQDERLSRCRELDDISDEARQRVLIVARSLGSD